MYFCINLFHYYILYQNLHIMLKLFLKHSSFVVIINEQKQMQSTKKVTAEFIIHSYSKKEYPKWSKEFSVQCGFDSHSMGRYW